MKLGKFIFGAAIGATLGLLLAPKKGSELRKDIKEKSKDTYDKVKNLTKEDVEAILGETIENVKKSVDEFDSEAFKASTKVKLEDLQTKLQNLAEKVKDSDQYEKVANSAVTISNKLNNTLEDVKQNIFNSDSYEQEISEVEDELDEIIDEMKD